MKQILKTIIGSLVLIFGISVFIFGGYDDSPGAQLIGVLVFASGVSYILKIRKQSL